MRLTEKYYIQVKPIFFNFKICSSQPYKRNATAKHLNSVHAEHDMDMKQINRKVIRTMARLL